MIPHSKPTLDAAAAKAVAKVLLSGQIAQGTEVAAFEKEMARFLGRRDGVAVSSGTAALHLALLGLGVGRGNEVMIPSFVCSALLQAVRYIGAWPVLLDIDPADFTFSTMEIRKKKSRRTKALILPHSFGFPLDMAEYSKLGIPVIEDVAQAAGAKWGGKRVGADGVISILSFYATKMMTTGEGGMLLCDRSSVAAWAKTHRSYDEKEKADLSFNYKMTDFQAALGRLQLRQLPRFIERRRAVAAIYRRAVQEFSDAAQLPSVAKKAFPVYYRFVFRHRRARWLIRELNAAGIGARPPVFKPLHHYLGKAGFPGTDLLFRELVSIPIYPSLSDKEVFRVVRSLRHLLIREEK